MQTLQRYQYIYASQTNLSERCVSLRAIMLKYVLILLGDMEKANGS